MAETKKQTTKKTVNKKETVEKKTVKTKKATTKKAVKKEPANKKPVAKKTPAKVNNEPKETVKELKKETKKAAPKKAASKKTAAKKPATKKKTKAVKDKTLKAAVSDIPALEIKAKEEAPLQEKEETPVLEEIKEPASIEVEEIKEENKLEAIREMEEAKANANKKSPVLAIVLAVVVVALIVLAVLGFSGKLFGSKIVNLSDIDPYYTRESGTIKLPSGWYVSEEGNLFVKNHNTLKNTGMIATTSIEESELNEFINDKKGQFDVNVEENANGFTVYSISETFGEDECKYFFMYKDGTLAQVFFLNANEKDMNEIVANINF